MKPHRAFALVASLSMLSLTGCDLVKPRPLGEKLWRSRCADCHGVDGSGNTPRFMGNPWADLRDNSWKHGGDRSTVESVIREGIFGKMPAVDDLSVEEMRALLDYLYQLRGERT